MGVSPGGPDRTVVSPPRGMFDFLPWRRHGENLRESELTPLLRLVRHHHPGSDVRPILKAYALARDAHAGQVRKSGDPYLVHPVAVATILADLGMDVTTIIAGLLHDVVEDTSVSLEMLSVDFGEDIAKIVDGVTKLERIRFETREAQQAATMRKMLVAMADDIRVLVVKLADRLHNMRTLAPLSEVKRRRTAQETLDIYAPLARRLGIREIRWQLEDLAFQELHPKAHKEIAGLVQTRRDVRQEELASIVFEVKEKLRGAHIPCKVTGRSKHLWSIYQKMVTRQHSFAEIYDLIGIRIIVPTVRDCYAALGTIHATWTPVSGRFKDYIATPKFNLYQSLHTTVVCSTGNTLEVQIRTQDMHRMSEYGIAAHWRYKDGERPAMADPYGLSDSAWVSRMKEWQGHTEDPGEFMDTIKGDLYRDEVYVFTPKGDLITLPTGATPIDFAYAIHTEVGHRCIGARLNGVLASLESTLESGDTIEIFISKLESAGPSREWVSQAVTPRARNRIRAWFHRESREESSQRGRFFLDTALRDAGMILEEVLVDTAIEHVAEEMSYTDVGALYVAIGDLHLRADTVVSRLLHATEHDYRWRPVDRVSSSSVRRSRSAAELGIHVEGLDDISVRLSRCCDPLPGQKVTGHLARGREVSVHRTDCTNAATAKDRLIEVEWDNSPELRTIHVEALDRPGLLADLTVILSEYHVDIRAAHTVTGNDRIAILDFDVEVGDIAFLGTILNSLLEIESVFEARWLQGEHDENESGSPEKKRPPCAGVVRLVQDSGDKS